MRSVRVFMALAMLILVLRPMGMAQEKATEKLGKVVFPTSCDPKVQPRFERAVALLHSFSWQEGEKAFGQVLADDPSCAIATWGIAAILIGNTFGVGPTPEEAQKAKKAIARGREIGAKTERERYYIEAIAEYYDSFSSRSHATRMKHLADAFEIVTKRFSEDDEAQTFHAIYLTATQSSTDKTFAAALKSAQILEAQFVKHPDHPGVAHYLIHSYDYPPIADKGLPAAKRYAEIAPSAPHALHMPSHIFTRVGAWEDSIATNRRSAAASKAANEPGSGLHAMDYLVYAYMQLARDKEASRIVEEAKQVTNLGAPQGGPYAFAAIPARYAVERGAWKDAMQLHPQSSRFPYTEAMTYFARALGAARSGDAVAAEKDAQELARIVNALKNTKNDYWATEVEVERLSAAAWTAYAKGQRDEALSLMRSAADMEDKSEKSAVTPGRILPARELLGEMLLEMKRPSEALQEFEASQKREPNRFRGIYGAGKAAEQSGDMSKAKSYYKKLAVLAQNADTERPELQQAKVFLAKQ
jgi:tetratricopeptide (TPR) repeat protein